MCFEDFEKTIIIISKLPHSRFRYVDIATWVTKLFRTEEENMRCGKIQLDRTTCVVSFVEIGNFQKSDGAMGSESETKTTTNWDVTN